MIITEIILKKNHRLFNNKQDCPKEVIIIKGNQG